MAEMELSLEEMLELFDYISELRGYNMREDEMKTILGKLEECLALADKGDKVLNLTPRCEIACTLRYSIEQIKRYINWLNE